MTKDTGIRTGLKIPFEEAIGQAIEALQTEGFGVLTQIDVQITFKEKIHTEFRRYIILAACNPVRAHRAISVNADVGLLLPCNVTVQEGGDHIIVTALDPLAMMGSLEEDAEVRAVAAEARAKLEKVIALLK